ncbi:pro-neuregulin-1, membrane-bound isoform isoform X2 [Gouania willdenowi]|uniref:pro-neuregulin-1, membrane-bound isoform isoform X2 n=1 Tax=Gouania willdenowi TaxID=441366 RepID=UPI001054EFED|nr:pro-neuregulin-3, membrane-bound isoform-like isoform X2 [Gouania willdenowi]
MTEGSEDSTAGPVPPSGSATPTGSTADTGHVPKEKPEEMEAAGESLEEVANATAEGSDGEGERVGALGIVALPGTCCVCIEMERINNCLHSEKICILPILACLLSLALCTAGLKWVFVDKIFEYEPPTHLDPRPIGQDPIIISVNHTLGITVSIPHSSPSTLSLTTTIAITSGHPEVIVEEKSTRGPYMPQSPGGTDSSVTLRHNAERPTNPKQTQPPQELDNNIPTISSTSTSTTAKTSSHVTPCSDSQRNFCVNGGECYILKITEGNTKFLCRCPNEFTGDRCQNYVMASFFKADELYQKRVLTITGICIALLVVGIMCVVAYCKTNKQRRKLRERLRQSLKKKRNNNTSSCSASKQTNSTTEPQVSSLPLHDLQLISHSNGITAQHAPDKETETTLSMSKNALSAHEATTFTFVSNQRCFSPVTTMTGPFPEIQTSPCSPPSEMSGPLSSLAVSVPSVVLSLSGEEERLLLRSPHKSSRDERKRTSAHYNHGHMAQSLPSSPLLTTNNVTVVGHNFFTSPKALNHKNNIISNDSITLITDNILHYMESNEKLVSRAEDLSEVLNTDNTTVLWLRALDNNSRTNLV